MADEEDPIDWLNDVQDDDEEQIDEAIEDSEEEFNDIKDQLQQAATNAKTTAARDDDASFTQGTAGGEHDLSDTISDQEIIEWAKSNGFSSSDAAQAVENAFNSQAALSRSSLPPKVQNAAISKMQDGEPLSDFIDRVYKVVRNWETEQEEVDRRPDPDVSDREIRNWVMQEGLSLNEVNNLISNARSGNVDKSRIPPKILLKLQGPSAEEFRKRVQKRVQDLGNETQETWDRYSTQEEDQADYGWVLQAVEIMAREDADRKEAEQNLWLIYGGNTDNADFKPNFIGLTPGSLYQVDEDTFREWVDKALVEVYGDTAEALAHSAGKASSGASQGISNLALDSIFPLIVGLPIVAIIGFLLFITFGMSLLYTVVVAGGAVALLSSFSIEDDSEIAEFEAAFIFPLWIMSTVFSVLYLTRSEWGIGIGIMAFGAVTSSLFIAKHIQATEDELQTFIEGVINWYIPESNDAFVQREWAVIVIIGAIVFPLQLFFETTAFTYLYLSGLAPISLYWMMKDNYSMARNAKSQVHGAAEKYGRGGEVIDYEDLSSEEQDVFFIYHEAYKLIAGEGQPLFGDVPEPEAGLYYIASEIQQEIEGEDEENVDQNKLAEIETLREDLDRAASAADIKHEEIQDADLNAFRDEMEQILIEIDDAIHALENEFGRELRQSGRGRDLDICQEWLEEVEKKT